MEICQNSCWQPFNYSLEMGTAEEGGAQARTKKPFSVLMYLENKSMRTEKNI